MVVIAITFFSMFRDSGSQQAAPAPQKPDMEAAMPMTESTPMITPRLVNLVVPMLTVIVLSSFFLWRFGSERSGDSSVLGAIANTEPNRAMLVALFIAIFTTTIVYAFQKYDIKEMVPDFISGGNDIMPTLVILAVAWPLASVSQALGMNAFIEQLVGSSLPQWSVAVTLFLLSAAITYFIGSGWGAASLVMPFAIPLAVSVGAGVPLCVAAVITGRTFGDITSPVAGMANMASNVARADHAKDMRYAAPYNFAAAGIAAVLFVVAGLVTKGAP